jgi:hypothetical protein
MHFYNKIPKCQLVEISGVGHIPQTEAFGNFNETALAFIGQ